jgi:hypothetical protein
VATDTFTNANGTTLPSHSATWVTPTGNTPMEIQNNSAVGDGWESNYYNVATANAHYSKITLHASVNSEVAACIRMQTIGVNHFYALYVSGTVFIGEFIAGNPSDWDSQGGFVAGDIIEIAIDASVSDTVHLKKNGTLVQTYTGKNALSGGFAGVAGTTASTFGIETWEGGDVSTPTAPTLLTPIRSGVRFY